MVFSRRYRSPRTYVARPSSVSDPGLLYLNIFPIQPAVSADAPSAPSCLPSTSPGPPPCSTRDRSWLSGQSRIPIGRAIARLALQFALGDVAQPGQAARPRRSGTLRRSARGPCPPAPARCARSGTTRVARHSMISSTSRPATSPRRPVFGRGQLDDHILGHSASATAHPNSIFTSSASSKLRHSACAKSRVK